MAGEDQAKEVLAQALGEIRHLRRALAAAKSSGNEPVAVVGMGCRVSGAAGPAQFWELVRSGADAIRDVPDGRWDVDRFYDPDPQSPGKMYTKRGAFLDDVDLFDAAFFGISPREAAEMDPQQRLFLEVGWEALENAGLAADRLAGSRTAVFMGVTGADYTESKLQRNKPAELNAYCLTGYTSTFATGRLSYWLGLRGPSMAVDTACSSSLVAVHLAVQSLRSGDSTMALAGGVNLMLSPEKFIILSKAGMMAPDGRCKTFDRAADGYGRGEGCGVVVLKLLSRALAENDRILAVIRGTAVNQDGRSAGITAPNGLAQQDVVRQALANAGIDGSRVSYVEAHGTGTALGDPIEVRALGSVLSPGRDNSNRFAVGSVKTNVGHLESAAGVAGLIKTVMSLQHREIPPVLHFTEVNPEIPLDELRATIPTALIPWPSNGLPRVAGVNSFGASGTNAHVIVEEAPPPVEPGPAGPERPLHLVSLSARSEKALTELVQHYHRYLAAPADSLGDIAFTANHGRSHFSHRLAAVVGTPLRLRELLADHLAGKAHGDIQAGVSKPGAQPRIAFLFTGQGSQYAGMGRELYDTQPAFRADLDRCDAVLRGHLDRPLLSLLFPAPGEEPLIDQTRYTQPALFALEYALARLWRSWGVEPAAMLGHSVGEYAAACLAGVFGLEEGLALIATRARLMQELPAGGAMAALLASEERVAAAIEPYRDSLSVAAVNGPESVVVSGAESALAALVAELEAGGVKTKPLSVSHAFHSQLLEPMLDAFEKHAAQLSFAAPAIPLVSNLTGRPVDQNTFGARYFREHARKPVQFMAGVRQLVAQGCTMFLEIGPAPVLCGMARTVAGPDARYLPSLSKGQGDWAALFRSLSTLYVHGAGLDWAGLERDYPRQRVALPTYPFQRKRHWMTAVEPATAPAGTMAPPEATEVSSSILGRRIASPLEAVQFRALLSVDAHPSLNEAVFEGTAVVNAGFYVEAALEAAAELYELDEVRITGLVMPRGLIIPPEGRQTTQLVLEPREDGHAAFRYYSQLPENGWALHAEGGIGPAPPAPAADPVDVKAIRRRCRTEISGHAFYRSMWQRGLHFGPSVQWHERIVRGDGEALSWMRPAHPDETSAYRLHPGIVDAALHLLQVCSAQDLPPSVVYMLLEVAEIAFYGYAGEGLLCHALVREDNAAAGSMTVDIRLLTEQGRCVALLRGVHMRRVNREAVLRAASAAARPSPGRPAVTARPAGDAALRQALREAGKAEAAQLLRSLLVKSTAAVLRSSAADIDEHEALQNLGVDSLLAVELKDVVATAMGVQLSAATFMDNPSIAGLADILLPMVREPRAEPACEFAERTGPGGMHVAELGAGPPVVLIHGGAVGGADAWLTQVALAGRWRLIIPSRLTYGKSPARPREDFDEDAPLIAELLGDGAHVVAHSYGTVGAMFAALRRPEAVWSLTIIESAASSVARGRPAVDKFERDMQAMLAAPPDDPEDQFRALFAIIEPNARYPSPLPPNLQDFSKRIATGVRWPWEAEIPFEALRAAPFPKLIVSGGQRPVFEEISDALADRIGGERLVVPGGHATQNAGTAFNERLEDFLNRARPQSRRRDEPSGWSAVISTKAVKTKVP
jgi:acyl transferase domain-containing protein